MLLSLIVIVFACEKEEKPAPEPIKSVLIFPFPKATLKIYPTKQDWLAETNPLFNEFSANGKFEFVSSIPNGTYYYDVYDSAYIHRNINPQFYYSPIQKYEYTDISAFDDLYQTRYLFLKDQKESNWKMTEYGGNGFEAAPCAKLRTMVIDKEAAVSISDGELCADPKTYKYAFYLGREDTDIRTLVTYESYDDIRYPLDYDLQVMEKVNGEATKLKIYYSRINNSPDYEIYVKQ